MKTVIYGGFFVCVFVLIESSHSQLLPQNPNERRRGENKFIEAEDGIIFDHVDFVMLRLNHILKQTSNNISEIMSLQQKEFKVNKSYKNGWEAAAIEFNETLRTKIFNRTSVNSVIQKVPSAYHIAVIAYTGSMYGAFNRDTREICAGYQINGYNWKSYFKLLQLAIEALGSETRWKDNNKFLYRGAGIKHNLKKGQVLAFQHFVSTSTDRKSAENFASATLLQFEGLYNRTAMAVWDHSYYPIEREVLFSPLQVFQVDGVHNEGTYTRYVLVKYEFPIETVTCAGSQGQKDNGISRLGNLGTIWVVVLSSLATLVICVAIFYTRKLLLKKRREITEMSEYETDANRTNTDFESTSVLIA